MYYYYDFFINLDFDFNQNIKSKKIYIDNNLALNKKLEGNFLFYKNPNQTNTSFYFISQTLDIGELRQVRKYIWNENKADLLFYLKNDDPTQLVLQYAKVSPNISDDECELDRFNITIGDQNKLDKIQRWKFDSGLFWTNYQDFLAKSRKFKSIDKELVGALEALKNRLSEAFSLVSDNIEKREEYVQALIDRTLYIKYLEDNQIINSYFYEHHFGHSEVDYKKLLLNTDSIGLNQLFEIIHNIFNNELFEKPTIPKKYLNSTICGLIQDSLNHNIEVRQLRLFDFRFDIIPIEFISYIYEIFLTDKQKENGIYYTPKKLAQLIVDDVIAENEIGSVLDPSCGSGMFLITAFQRLLENSNEVELKDVATRIEYRTKLIKDNIFGIEKELTAQRFTLFSLSLQLFRGIEKTQVRDFIAKQLQEKGQVELFKKHSFFNNIQHANSLEIDPDIIPHKGETFSYIIGNPPFFEVKNTNRFKTEIDFINKYKYNKNVFNHKVKDIVGRHQISQCFFIKIKDWSNENTKFGFVSNSSNFYNDKSIKFQDFFYSEYNIKTIYELSQVKEILFENAKENVIALIFSNHVKEKNQIQYYPVKKGLFSKKPFELLIIQEDKYININQFKLSNKTLKLRDFLVGNNYDIGIIKLIHKNSNTLNEYLQINNRNTFVHRGIEIVGASEVKKEYQIPEGKWDDFSKKEKDSFYKLFKEKHSSRTRSLEFPTPFIKTKNFSKFKINSIESYLGDTSKFHRPRDPKLFIGDKILWSRIGQTFKAVFSKEKLYYDFDIYVLKLKDANLYNLFTAILNSQFVEYYINQFLKKRIGGSFPKIGINDIKSIPIPTNLNEYSVSKISDISSKLINNKIVYNNDIEYKLNELIFDLYDLSYIERQRVKDYFLDKKVITKSGNEIVDYIETLKCSIDVFLNNPVTFESEHNTGLGLLAIKVNLNGFSNSPLVKKTGLYLLNEIFKQNPQENFLASREKIWGKDCVYIIKQDINVNWTKTKAYEDGQEILKKLMD